MGFIKKWFLKGQITKLVSKLSWKLDGRKSWVTSLMIALLILEKHGLPFCGACVEYATVVLDALVQATGTSREVIMQLTAVAHLGALWHKGMKRLHEKSGTDESP